MKKILLILFMFVLVTNIVMASEYCMVEVRTDTQEYECGGSIMKVYFCDIDESKKILDGDSACDFCKEKSGFTDKCTFSSIREGAKPETKDNVTKIFFYPPSEIKEKEGNKIYYFEYDETEFEIDENDPRCGFMKKLFGGCKSTDVKYECQVSIRPTGKIPCNFVGGKDKICQLPDKLVESEDEIPEYCGNDCVKKSKYLESLNSNNALFHKDCITVSLAHSGFSHPEISPEERRILTKSLDEVWLGNEKELTDYVGEVIFKEGRVLIERGTDLIPVVQGTKIMPCDVVVVENGAKATLMLEDTEEVKITQQTKFTIPCKYENKKMTNKISFFFGGLWVKLKKLVQGESYDLRHGTAVIGTRG